MFLHISDVEAFWMEDPLLLQSPFIFLQLDIVVSPDWNLVRVESLREQVVEDGLHWSTGWEPPAVGGLIGSENQHDRQRIIPENKLK